MLNPELFYKALQQEKVSYFTGVPDSLLKHFCAYITDNVPQNQHTIAANEGAAIGLAIGHHFATADLPLVYMQNSGLGNIINPLTSLADPAVYSTPMLLMIGWRGEPGIKDEPQHIKQGEVTLGLLEALSVPYTVIDGSEPTIQNVISIAAQSARTTGGAHALVIKKGSFDSYNAKTKIDDDFGWTREDAIKMVVDMLDEKDVVVCTTGMASRELFEYREATGSGHEKDFLTVGGMGHASQIALGIANQKPNRRVICIDGDGAALMHMGSLAIIGMSKIQNYKHIVLNNGAHDSVGGQPTAGFSVNLPQIAIACGYQSALVCDSSNELKTNLTSLLSNPGPSMLEIRVNKGNRNELGRPTTTPLQNKQAFMSFLRE